MDMGRALEILGALADGLDPFTGEPAAKDSILQNPDTIRALHLALTVLERGESKPSIRKANSYNPWSSEEDAKLCKEFHSSMDFAEIANIHGPCFWIAAGCNSNHGTNAFGQEPNCDPA